MPDLWRVRADLHTLRLACNAVSRCITMPAMFLKIKLRKMKLRKLNLILLSLSLSLCSVVVAQDAGVQPVLIGTWEGELVRGRDNMTLAFTFEQNQGIYTAAITSSALGIFGMPVETISVDRLKLNIKIPRLDLEFYGTLRLSADGTRIERIDGDYYQSSEMVPVVLKSVAKPSF